MTGSQQDLARFFPYFLLFTATLADKRKEEAESAAPSSPVLSLLISPSFSSSFSISSSSSSPSSPSPSSHHSNMKLASNMSNQLDQQSKQMPSTSLNRPETNTLNKDQLTDDDEDDDNLRASHQHRRLPLPSKLSFEQNITHLIEKESPLLQSELLTAEHELSVLRSRLAVNEGVTAITGTILESLKGQFDRSQSDKITTTTAVITTMSLPKSMEIHYDAQSNQSPYLVLKSLNSYWIAQPIDNNQMEEHLKTFSSPVMKRATIRTPEQSSDSDGESKQEVKRLGEILSPVPPVSD